MRIDDLVSRRDRLLGNLETLKAQESSLRTQIRSMEEERELLERVLEVLKKMVEWATKQDLEKVEKFVTSGLGQVIHDQSIQCAVSLHEQSGASKVLIEGVKGDVRGDFLESFGGGVWNIASYILRVISILRMGLRRRIFMDEAFTNLSVEYQPAAAELCASLCKKLAFKKFLVTHQSAIAEGADHVYRAFTRNNELVLEKER